MLYRAVAGSATNGWIVANDPPLRDRSSDATCYMVYEVDGHCF